MTIHDKQTEAAKTNKGQIYYKQTIYKILRIIFFGDVWNNLKSQN